MYAQAPPLSAFSVLPDTCSKMQPSSVNANGRELPEDFMYIIHNESIMCRQGVKLVMNDQTTGILTPTYSRPNNADCTGYLESCPLTAPGGNSALWTFT
jgi:hypothetical protein